MSEYELYHASARKHKYIKKIGNRYFYTQQEIAAYLKTKKGDVTFEKSVDDDYYLRDGSKMKEYRVDFNKHKGADGKTEWSDGVGVRVGNKRIEYFNTRNQKYAKNPDVKNDNKGRLKSQYAEDGVVRSFDYSDRKTFKNREKARRELEKKWGIAQDEPEPKKRKRRNAKTVAKKTASKTLKSMRKKALKGKKALDKWYTKATTPDITVTYNEAKIK